MGNQMNVYAGRKSVFYRVKCSLLLLIMTLFLGLTGCGQAAAGSEQVSDAESKTAEMRDDDGQSADLSGREDETTAEDEDVKAAGEKAEANAAGEKSDAKAAGEKTEPAEAVKKKSYYDLPETYPVSDAMYLTEDMIVDRARRVLSYAAANKYVYGDSKETPPCTDGKISCDRLIASVLWSLGFTDQPSGGFVVKDEANENHDMSMYLKQHGFVESIGMDEVKRGSILIVTDMRGHWKGHAFILGDMNGDTVELPDGDNVKRYDAGDVWASASSTGEYPEEPVQGWPYPKDDSVFVYNLPEITEAALAGVYDYDYYIAHYPTVKKVTGGDRARTLQFFFSYGIDQGHQGCQEFNVLEYRDTNPELQDQYHDDLRSYYYHYLMV